jgi:hypothetical protein
MAFGERKNNFKTLLAFTITLSISTQFFKSLLRSTMTLSQVFVSYSMPWDPRVSGRGLRFRLGLAKHTGAFSFQ